MAPPRADWAVELVQLLAVKDDEDTSRLEMRSETAMAPPPLTPCVAEHPWNEDDCTARYADQRE